MGWFDKSKNKKDIRMKISVNRDGICMGDDCEDHRKMIEVNDHTNVSDFLFILSDYVPQLQNVIWAIRSNNGICGYIITDDNAKASIDLCGKDATIKDADIHEVMCIHFYPSRFSYIDRKSGEQINKYPECNTFLEKVKKETGVI